MRSVSIGSPAKLGCLLPAPRWPVSLSLLNLIFLSPFCRSNQYKNKFLPRQNKNKTAIAIFGLTKGLSPKCIT